MQALRADAAAQVHPGGARSLRKQARRQGAAAAMRTAPAHHAAAPAALLLEWCVVPAAKRAGRIGAAGWRTGKGTQATPQPNGSQQLNCRTAMRTPPVQVAHCVRCLAQHQLSPLLRLVHGSCSFCGGGLCRALPLKLWRRSATAFSGSRGRRCRLRRRAPLARRRRMLCQVVGHACLGRVQRLLRLTR